MTDSFHLRPARATDATHLATFADTATGSLSICLWRLSARPGQSAVEVGRGLIRSVAAAPIHHSNWQVVETAGEVQGGLLGFPLGPEEAGAAHSDAPAFLEPLTALKAMAVDSWFLSVIAVFEEARGAGLGTALLKGAEQQAAQAGCARISLITSSRNTGALGLYTRHGYEEVARRPFLPFPGSHEDGDWVLMIKSLPR